MNQKPFIHLFKTPLGYYFYDVNMGQIVRIDEEIYELLQELLQNDDPEVCKMDYIKDLQNQGFLKNDRVQIVEHPYTEILPYALDAKVHILILQLTQNCNLRCDYCLYSGNYYTREHQNKKMSLQTAKRAIDFLRTHSTEKDKVYIVFYGGEPLLEFNMIQACVAYADQTIIDKEIEYSMTTNGTLLQEEVIDFIVEHNMKITVSIDGPRTVHDKNRRFAGTDRGSFDVIWNKLHCFKNKYPDYYKQNVRFNTVLSTEESFSCSDIYFKEDELFKDSIFSLSGISTSFSKNKTEVSEQYVEEEQYELFKFFMSLFGRIKTKDVSVLLKEYEHRLLHFEHNLTSLRSKLPKKWHRGGPCIPGIVRLFVNSDGNFYPCEKVSEMADVCKIGNLEEGFNIEKIKTILNIERMTQEECRECWAYTECTTCIRRCDDCDNNNRNNILKTCKSVKDSIDETFKDYMVLKELGYNFSEKNIETSIVPSERFAIKIPVVMIANIFTGMKGIDYDCSNALKKEIEKLGYRVELLNGEELVDENLSAKKNITKINSAIKKSEVEKSLDLIIITIPGNCIEISDKYCGDGGTYLHMFIQSVYPDLFIVNVPYSMQFVDDPNSVCEEIENAINVEIDCFNIVPEYLDLLVSEEEDRLDFLTLETEFVQERIEGKPGLYCIDDKKSREEMTLFLVEKLAQYAETKCCCKDSTMPSAYPENDWEIIIKNIFKRAGFARCTEGAMMKQPLFGNTVRMRARDLLVIVFEIEKQFSIQIKRDDINRGRCSSFESLVECVQEYLI